MNSSKDRIKLNHGRIFCYGQTQKKKINVRKAKNRNVYCFFYKLWLKLTFAVAGNVNIYFAKAKFQGFETVTIVAVVGILAAVIVLDVAQLIVQLRF